jgi:hypothetical protein
MALAKSYKKNIVCLESFWDHKLENRLSVLPILELVARHNDIKFIHLTCNTPQELIHNLNILPRRNGYSILYLAFHGKPGRIVLDKVQIKLETIAEIIGKRLANWIIHFGGCKILSVEEHRIKDFISSTRVLMVSGYRKDINWLSGTVIDLLFFDEIQFYRGMRSFWSRFNDNSYPLESLGLEAFHR